MAGDRTSTSNGKKRKAKRKSGQNWKQLRAKNVSKPKKMNNSEQLQEGKEATKNATPKQWRGRKKPQKGKLNPTEQLQRQEKNSKNSTTEEGKKPASEKKPKAEPRPLLQTQVAEGDPTLFVWNSTLMYIPRAAEDALLPHLVMHRKSETGIMRDQPAERVAQIRQLCQDHGMDFLAALSLRREIINCRWKPKGVVDPSLKQAAKSAQLLEDALEDFLQDNKIDYWSEDEQRINNGKPLRPTPDVLLHRQVLCRRIVSDGSTRVVQGEQVINWIDAKMFYGASSIPQNNKSSVGKLIQTGEKYVKLFGPGALFFQFGCGDELASKLAEVGVLALDASASVNLEHVEESHRTWCGTKDGQILF